MIAAIHFFSATWRRTVRGLALCLAFVPGLGLAETLPRHFDPNARQSAQATPSLPALRFLTAADYPPFNFRDADGLLVGYNVDLATAICTDLNTICTLQDWPWDQAADALADNQGDALIGGLAIDSTTGERFDFSSIYLRFPGRFVTGKDAVADFSPVGLTGKSVAVRAGSRHEDFIRTYLPGAGIVEAGTEFEALDLVGSGKADAYFGDGLRAAFWLGQNTACCGFAGMAYFRPDYFGEGLAVAVAPGRNEVIEAIDIALVRLAKSGKLDELYLKWFPIGFY